MTQTAGMETDPNPSASGRRAILDLLLARRSTPIALLAEPGPTPEQLAEMVTAASRVPDHGQLHPWRFLVYRGPVRDEIGQALAALAETRSGPLSPGSRAKELTRFNRAPVVVGVIASPKPSPKIPETEMLFSAGAAAFALELAAMALGFGAFWVTNWYSNDPDGRAILGLAEHERVAGLVHIGTPTAAAPERPRLGWEELLAGGIVADYPRPPASGTR